MTNEQLILNSQRFSKYLTSRDAAVANGYLEKVKEENFLTLQTIKFKSPMTGLILGWFLGAFGGGAFYAKKIGFGTAQVIAFLLYIACMVLSMTLFANGSIDFETYSLLLACSAPIMWILYIIGLACVWKWVKKYNFQKLMEILPLL